MPPFIPHKRLSSEDPPSAKRQAVSAHNDPKPVDMADFQSSDSDSSLTDAPSSDEFEDVQGNGKNIDNDDDDDEDDEVDWEDAMDTKTTSAATLITPAQDLELTLDKNEVQVSAGLDDAKKGPSKIERQIRIQTHCMHVQCLLFHNALRNAWLNDPKVHDILRGKLPAGIQKEVQKWRIASGLEVPEKKKQPKKGKKKARDWGDDSSRLEPGQPDMSRGDPVISLLKVLAAYWKKQFKITAPGLRKHGYRPMTVLEAEISSFHQDDHNPERHGERIRGKEEFRSVAERMEGSRDVGAQLFTALLRALGIEARLVGSLQPLGFGWTKAETYASKAIAPVSVSDPESNSNSDSDSDSEDEEQSPTSPKRYDGDLPFPVYWTEVASPITHEIIPVDPLVLPNPVATTPELQAAFEPRGAKAERAKQVICYVVAHSSDGTAKDVTTRYLRRRTWPGKTKGYRIPVEKIPGQRGNQSSEYDWFRVTMRGYVRPENKPKTRVDEIEDAKDLVAKQPEKKNPAKEKGDTLQSLRTSSEFVLERFLRREEALRPGATPVRTFIASKGNGKGNGKGKGVKEKVEEKVFRRADVLKCLSAESWHKEGRQIKVGEPPLKRVPIRAVTLQRKREVDELQRETGEKPTQGLYAAYQTEAIVPPPIEDGIIPKNEYGNIDCFVPGMVPRGAVHIPWPGTVRVCKKLGIDYAEAVTGFEFGSKIAVPVIQGVVVAEENEGLVKDAWRADDAEKRKRERLKAEKRILQTWRKFLFGLRIADRVREEYGGDDDDERDSLNPFSAGRSHPPPSHRYEHEDEDDDHREDRGGGFLLPGDDEQGGGFLLPAEEDAKDGGLIVEGGPRERPRPVSRPVDDESDLSSVVSPPEQDDNDDDHDDSESEYEQPVTKRQTRKGRSRT